MIYRNSVKVVQMKDAEITRNWGWIAQLLEPAVKVDPNRTMQGLYSSLIDGRTGLASLHHADGAMLLVVEPIGDGDDMILWIPYLAGQIKRGRFVPVMREGMAQMEDMARESGCAEIRLCGRNWGRVFSDYETMPDWPNGLKKVLH